MNRALKLCGLVTLLFVGLTLGLHGQSGSPVNMRITAAPPLVFDGGQLSLSGSYTWPSARTADVWTASGLYINAEQTTNLVLSSASKLTGGRFVPLIINPEHNSVGGSTVNNLAVVCDFAQFYSTNSVLAWGASATSASAIQEFYRGASFVVPDACKAFGTTALVIRVFGSTSSVATNALDLLITDPETGMSYATNGLATATPGEWTGIPILKDGTMFTNAMPGKLLHFRIDPWCWAGTTTALDSAVLIYGQ